MLVPPRIFSVAICLVCLIIPPDSYCTPSIETQPTGHSFDIDDLFVNEQIGKTALSPDGKSAAIVVIPSVTECARRRSRELVFYDDFIPEEACGEISVYSKGQTRRINTQPNTLGFFAPQWSPTGKRLALLSFDSEGGAHVWVWDGRQISKITDHPIDPYINIDAESGWDFAPFAWLSDDTLIAAVLSDGGEGADKVPVRHPGATLVPAWRAQASGEEASASTLASRVGRGNFPRSTLAKINVIDGGVRKLSTGSFTALTLSPTLDKALVTEAISNPQTAKGDLLEHLDQNIIPNGFSLGLSHSRIGVINLSQDNGTISWLPSIFDPWFSSIGRRDLDDRGAVFEGPRPTWSHDGDRVAFVARHKPQIGAPSKLFVYRFSSAQALEIQTSGLAPVSIVWAADNLLYAQFNGGDAGQECAATWCVVDSDGRSRNAFDVGLFGSDAPNRLFGVRGALWFTALNDLWAINVEEGGAVRLTDGEFGKVGGISAVSVTGDSVLVETQENNAGFIEVSSVGGLKAQRQGTRVRPAPASVVKAFGGVNGVTITEHAHSQGIDLWVQSGSAEQATKALSLNRHLLTTSPIERQLLIYEGQDGEELTGILLHSAHAAEASNAPLVVRVYPTTYSNPDLFKSSVNSRLFLNDALLPARGYAVLYPTITIKPPAAGGPLCSQFASDVLPAIDAAIADGGIDPDRIVLFGHSFGGYVVNSLMTCTDRFAAGISIAGFSDIFESYWRLPPPYKYNKHAMNADFGFHRAERSRQGVFNMGATPWTNPDIYIENSPVFHADRLNKPLLLMHGEFDAVSIAHSEKMYMAGRRLGKDVTFVRYWGVGHMWRSPGDVRDLWTKVFEFLDANGVVPNQKNR